MFANSKARDWRVMVLALALCAGAWCAAPTSARAIATPDRPGANGAVKGDPDQPVGDAPGRPGGNPTSTRQVASTGRLRIGGVPSAYSLAGPSQKAWSLLLSQWAEIMRSARTW